MQDLLACLRLAGEKLLHCVSSEKLYLPEGYEVAHNVGRWWEAALRLEETIGWNIPPETEQMLHIHLRWLMSNPYGLLLNDPEVFQGACLNLHNLREALLALSMLVSKRNSHWARVTGHRLVETMDRLYFRRDLSPEELCRELGVIINNDPMVTRPADDPFREEDFTPVTGRAIEGLLAFSKATGDALAEEVLNKAIAFHRQHTLRADGTTPEFLLSDVHVGHNHSYLGTLRGLLLVGLDRDPELVEEVYRTYRNSIPRVNCSPSGFAPHDLAKLRFSDQEGDPMGDHASCADTAYLAFLLATRGGHPELADDTERLIRARLFRSQIQEGADREAWGTYCLYFGQGIIMDVYALVTETLCRVAQDAISDDGETVTVWLHFSGDKEAVQVCSRRDDRQHLQLLFRQPRQFRLRFPAWADRSACHLADKAGHAWPFTFEGPFLTAAMDAGEYEVSFPLPDSVTEEVTFRSHLVQRIFWKGDQIVRTESREARH